MAYATRDRVLLCLGSPLEADGLPPPLDVLCQRTGVSPVGDHAQKTLIDFEPAARKPPPAMSFRMTRSGQASHLKNCSNDSSGRSIARSTRVRVPDWEEVERVLPPNFTTRNRVVWNLVCLGLVPGLAAAWETHLRTSIENSDKIDRVFGQSLFWVTTARWNVSTVWATRWAWISPVWPVRKSHVVPACFPATTGPHFRQRSSEPMPSARKLTSKPAEISPLTSTVSSTTSARDRGIVVLVAASSWPLHDPHLQWFPVDPRSRDNVFREWYFDSHAQKDGERVWAGKACPGSRVPR